MHCFIVGILTMLEKKMLSFALLKGMDEKSSDSSREPDALKKALNVEFTKKGQVSKRGGFVLTDSRTDKEAFGETGDISTGKAISKFQNETLIVADSNLYSKIGGSGLYNKGTYIPCTTENEFKRRQIDRRQSNAQIAENNGIRVYVWEEYKFANRYEYGTKYEIYADVEHIETGAMLVSRHLVESNTIAIDTDSVTDQDCLYQFGQPQCAKLGDRIFIVFKWVDGSSDNTLYYTSVNCASPENAVSIGSKNVLNDNGGTKIELAASFPVFEMDHCTGTTHSEAIALAFHSASTELILTYLVKSGATLVGSSTTPRLISTGLPDPEFNIFDTRAGINKYPPTGLMIKALNDGDSGASYTIIVGYTIDDSGTAKVQLVSVKDDLSAQNAYTADTTDPSGRTGNLWLLNGTAASVTGSATGAADVFCTLWFQDASTYASNLTGVIDNTLGQGVPPTPATTTTQQASIMPQHFVRSYAVSRNDGSFAISTVKTIAFNATVTSDFFRYNAENYCVISQVNDNALYADMSGSTTLQRGLNNNSVLVSADGELIGALRTGECCACFGSEWITICPPNGRDTENPGALTPGRETRRLWHGVQRVTARDTSTRFVFGGSRFAGYEFYAAGQYSTSDYPDNSFGISLFTVDFAPARTLASVDVERTWLGTGGFLHGYDGNQIFENNFVVYPAIRKLTQRSYSNTSYSSGVVGGYPNSKTIEYCAIYSWTDAKGNLQQSHPSEIVDVTTEAGLVAGTTLTAAGTSGYVADQVYATTVSAGSGTGAKICVKTVSSGSIATYTVIEQGTGYAASQTLTVVGGSGDAKILIDTITAQSKIEVDIYVPSFTRKTDISIEVYRNDADGGSVFYLAGQVPVPSALTKSYVTFTDAPADYAKITKNPIEIYTTPGVPPNNFIGSCTDLVRHQNKIYAAGIDDTVYMSNGIQEGTDVGFVPDFPNYKLTLPGDPGKITAIESNLDHFIIFTSENGFYVTGSGPSIVGQGSFSPPRLFASDQGAKSGSAHTDSPLGVFYQSDRGIYLIGRDMSVGYIGAAVEDTVGTTTAVNMLRHDDDNTVRIMLQAAAPGSSGTDVYCIFNYYFKQWSIFEVQYQSSAHQLDEIYDGTSFQRLTADGKQFKQSTSVYQDHNTAGSSLVNYSMQLDTGCISPTGLMKKDRIYRYMILGRYLAAHGLEIEVFNDYDTTNPTQTDSVNLTGAPTGLYLYRAHIKNQKSRAIQLSLVISGSTSGANIEGFALEVGMRPEKTSFKTISSRTL